MACPEPHSEVKGEELVGEMKLQFCPYWGQGWSA